MRASAPGVKPGDPPPLDSSVTNLPFPFCIRFLKRDKVGPFTAYAPSPELAALTVQQLLDLSNSDLATRGYPSDCLSASAGECQ